MFLCQKKKEDFIITLVFLWSPLWSKLSNYVYSHEDMSCSSYINSVTCKITIFSFTISIRPMLFGCKSYFILISCFSPFTKLCPPFDAHALFIENRKSFLCSYGSRKFCLHCQQRASAWILSWSLTLWLLICLSSPQAGDFRNADVSKAHKCP